MPSSTSDTTNGIKLELVVAYKNNSSPLTVRNAIANLLSAPIVGHCDLTGCELDHSHTIRLSDKKHADDSWSVFECRAVSISQEEMTAAARMTRIAPSVRSPSPNYGRWSVAGKSNGHCAWFSLRSEISYVLQIPNSINIQSGKNGLLAIYTNSSCSLQVHIGSHLPCRGITVDKTKRILQFLALFERALDSVQGDHRMRNGQMNTLGWVGALSGPQVWWRVLAAWTASFPITQSTVDLRKLLVPRKQPRAGSKQVVANRTIEFRQHAGTLDHDEVMAWVNVCETIVDFASAAGPGQVQQYAWDKWFDLNYSLPQILAHIGATEETITHYEQVLSTDDSYEHDKYNSNIRAIKGDPMPNLMQHAAMVRYLHSNRVASGMAVSCKVMNGHYGWLPQGSPYVLYTATLPVFGPENMRAPNTAILQDAAYDGVQLRFESPSLLSTSWDNSNDQELSPSDSASQVGAKCKSSAAISSRSDKADSGVSLGINADGQVDWVEKTDKHVEVEYDASEDRADPPKRRYSI